MLNGPEARHGTVINAVRRAGHALHHSCLHELVVKCPVGILEPSVAMEQEVRVWIGFHGIIKGFVNQWIVIAFAEHIGHDAPVAKVEDGAQIEFMYHYTVKSLEFRHLSETLFAQESVDKIRLRTLRAEDFRAGFMKSKCLGQIEI